MGSSRRINRWYSLTIIVIFSQCGVQFSGAEDTITMSTPIRDGEFLISEGGIFKLGFFTAKNGSSSRYVGIWYNNISTQTIVWIANRKNAINDTSGVLKIGVRSELSIVDGKGDTIWSTGAYPINNSVAVLLDSGNLVLREQNYTKRVMWESFDSPSDTLLPNMKLSLNLLSYRNRIMTSWRNKDDPSPGKFSCGVDPIGLKQLITWKDSARYYRTGQWNEGIASFYIEFGTKPSKLNDLYFLRDDNELYFTYNISKSSIYWRAEAENEIILTRMMMDYDGRIKQFIWSKSEQSWTQFWEFPKDQCDIYNHCGPYGICSNEAAKVCSCLDGFIPVSTEEWESGNWSSGCTRQVPLRCDREDSFLHLRNTKLPDRYYVFLDVSLGVQDCEKRCLSNCSCTAYASAYGNGTGCFLWGLDLVDLRNYSDWGGDLYVRLARTGSHGKKLLLVITITVSVGIFFLGIFLCLLWKRNKRKGTIERRQEQPVMTSGSSFTAAQELNNGSELGEDVMEGCDLPLLTFDTIATSTNNFSDSNKLGEGGFGPVHQGKLPNGLEIAVKRLSTSSGQGLEEFKNEIRIIANVQHKNLVRLLGCCIKGGERILIYEYMPNKSLDRFLFDPMKVESLDWQKRVPVILGVAQGLLYLHKYSRLKIIHRDLKSSNILLDAEMNPKISDFGLARIFGGNQDQANTNRVVGTYGYMSPEYAIRGLFSEKSDVFSFGVLLLEIVSGKKNGGFEEVDSSWNLLGYAWELWEGGRVSELMDPVLGNSCPRKELIRCIHVGLLCVQEDPADRPTMSSIVSMLVSDISNLPAPKRVAFSTWREDVYSHATRVDTFSSNDFNITTVRGR